MVEAEVKKARSTMMKVKIRTQKHPGRSEEAHIILRASVTSVFVFYELPEMNLTADVLGLFGFFFYRNVKI